MAEAIPEFYQKHRGGSGAVVVVTAIASVAEERVGVFGSLEAAMAWRESLGDNWTCIYAPYVVDDPDFGNRVNS